MSSTDAPDLIDTSVWIEYFRRTGSRAHLHLRDAIADRVQPALSEPVVMELMAGASNSRELAQIEMLAGGLPSLRVDERIDFRAAADVFRTARAAGLSVRTHIDCLIAVIAHRHGARIVHRDADFEAISTVLPVRTLDLRDLT